MAEPDLNFALVEGPARTASQRLSFRRGPKFEKVAKTKRNALLDTILVFVFASKNAILKSTPDKQFIEPFLKDTANDIIANDDQTTWVAYNFFFDPKTMLTGVFPFASIRETLRTKLLKIVHNEEYRAETHSKYPSMELKPELKPRIIFIALDLGCWVVQDMLGRSSASELSVRVDRVLLWNSPRRVDGATYEQYVKGSDGHPWGNRQSDDSHKRFGFDFSIIQADSRGLSQDLEPVWWDGGWERLPKAAKIVPSKGSLLLHFYSRFLGHPMHPRQQLHLKVLKGEVEKFLNDLPRTKARNDPSPLDHQLKSVSPETRPPGKDTWEINRLVRGLFIEGQSLYRRGRLQDSIEAHEEASAWLLTSSANNPSWDSLHVEMKIVKILLLQGDHLRARDKLDGIHLKGDTIPWEEEMREMRKKLVLEKLLGYEADFAMWHGDFALANDIISKLIPWDNEMAFQPMCLRKKHVKYLRNLAVTYAHLGDYEKARVTISAAFEFLKNHEISGDIPESRSVETTETMVSFSQAVVEKLAGNFQGALTIAQRASRQLHSVLGKAHFRTLECDNLVCHLLALLCRLEETEERCMETMRNSETELGNEHPTRLQTMYLLVFTWREQGRYVEAIDTGRSLLETLVERLGKTHPNTFDCLFELARIYTEAGEYKNAEYRILEAQDSIPQHQIDSIDAENDTSNPRDTAETTPQLTSSRKVIASIMSQLGLDVPRRSCTISCIPIILRCQLTQAYVYLSAGEVLRVTQLAWTSLPVLYRRCLGLPTAQRSMSMDELFTEILDYLEKRYNDGILNEKSFLEQSSAGFVHLDLLQNISIIANIWLQSQYHDIGLIQRSFEIALKWSNEMLGSFHDLTLTSLSDLALTKMMKETTTELEESRKIFLQLYHLRKRHFGAFHPRTSEAKLHFIVVSIQLEYWQNPDSTNPPDTLGQILRSMKGDMNQETAAVTTVGSQRDTFVRLQITAQELADMERCLKRLAAITNDSLGPHHPSTFKVSAIVFMVQLARHDVKGYKQTLQETLKTLRNKDVREKCLLRAMEIEDRIATTCASSGLVPDAIQIWSSLIGEARGLDAADNGDRNTDNRDIIRTHLKGWEASIDSAGSAHSQLS